MLRRDHLRMIRWTQLTHSPTRLPNPFHRVVRFRLPGTPGFHVIDHVFYHSDADTQDLVPAWGIEAVTRAYLKIIDSVNKMEITELVAANAPAEPSR